MSNIIEKSFPTHIDPKTLIPGKVYKLYDTETDKWEIVKFANFLTQYSVQLFPDIPKHVFPITGIKEYVDKHLQIYDSGVLVPIEAAIDRKTYNVQSEQYSGKARLLIIKYEFAQVYKRAAGLSGKFTNNFPRPMKFNISLNDPSKQFYHMGANIGDNHYPLPKLSRNTFRNNAWNRRRHLVANRNALIQSRMKPYKTRKNRK